LLNGSVDVVLTDGSAKTIQITRAHLEEDAGKSLHEDIHGMSGIDLNRAGTPLLEIVSEPDMRSAEEAVAYARQIHQLVTWLEVSDGDMSQGSMRCDANVSVRPRGSSEFGTRTETKNINSFRFLGRAIEHEIKRQIEVLESGGRIIQETRLYDPDNDETRSMRSKETAMDYRYFPEPDLLPVEIDDVYIEHIRYKMPELPHEKKVRFQQQYNLNDSDARALASDRHLSDYFEEVAAACGDETSAANWVRVELLGRLNKEDMAISQAPVPAAEVGTLIARINDQTISGKMAKSVFDALWRQEARTADEYIEAHGLTQVSDTGELEPIVDAIIEDNPKQVEQYKAGKTKVLGFF
ncbi:MAG: Asp-tRNA(Asn)/Glu-tRNA(Gln) amidotransferase subunit GatB, partial [Pseudomonadales bacterium]